MTSGGAIPLQPVEILWDNAPTPGGLGTCFDAFVAGHTIASANFIGRMDSMMTTEACQPTIWGFPANAVARALGRQTRENVRVVLTFLASKGVASGEKQKAIEKQVYRARRCMNPEYKGNDPMTGYFRLGQVPTLSEEQIAEFEEFVHKQVGGLRPVRENDRVRPGRKVPADKTGTPGLTTGRNERTTETGCLSDVVLALIATPSHDPNTDLSSTIPKGTGVYAWFTSRGDKMVYVGKAAGRTGLYRRIIGQHLNPAYLLTDQSDWRPTDAFQAAHPATSNGQPAIDKSAFRKNISRVHSLRPGKESVDFIKKHFRVRFVCIQGEGTIKALEDEIMARYHPEYNIQGNEGYCHPQLR